MYWCGSGDFQTLQDTERHRLLLIAGSGAVAICGVVS
jgi:hypothetical protein